MQYALLIVVMSAAQVVVKPTEPDRVGRVIIEGNADTPDRVIQLAVGQWPGQVLDRAKLGRAETRLNKLGLFRSASVEVLPCEIADCIFKDIRVRVEERSWVWLTFASEDLVVGVFTLDQWKLQETAGRVRAKLRGTAP